MPMCSTLMNRTGGLTSLEILPAIEGHKASGTLPRIDGTPAKRWRFRNSLGPSQKPPLCAGTSLAANSFQHIEPVCLPTRATICPLMRPPSRTCSLASTRHGQERGPTTIRNMYQMLVRTAKQNPLFCLVNWQLGEASLGKSRQAG